jgi:hypothetical protein
LGPIDDSEHDRLKNALGVLQNVIVPESQYSKAFPLKPGSPALIALGLTRHVVLPAVDFDDETWPEANDIDDIISDRLLAPEFVPLKLLAP